jgi:hypothetical protein
MPMPKTARKTIEVGKMLKMANTFLAAKNTNADEREAVASLLEAVLFETGNYRGFAYLPKENYAAEIGFESDGTRRRYFVSGTVDADYEAENRDINVIRV